MTIQVEFFGIFRQRTGVSRASLEFANTSVTLRDVLNALAARWSLLEGECIAAGELANGFTANVAGERFVRDPDATLCDGESLLLLSADAGG